MLFGHIILFGIAVSAAYIPLADRLSPLETSSIVKKSFPTLTIDSTIATNSAGQMLHSSSTPTPTVAPIVAENNAAAAKAAAVKAANVHAKGCAGATVTAAPTASTQIQAIIFTQTTRIEDAINNMDGNQVFLHGN